MMAPTQAGLLEELRRLSRQDREGLLALLEQGERDQLQRLLLLPSEIAEATPSFAALAGVSPWLLELIEQARDPAHRPATMTTAAVSALRKADAALPRTVGTKPAGMLKRYLRLPSAVQKRGKAA